MLSRKEEEKDKLSRYDEPGAGPAPPHRPHDDEQGLPTDEEQLQADHDEDTRQDPEKGGVQAKEDEQDGELVLF